ASPLPAVPTSPVLPPPPPLPAPTLPPVTVPPITVPPALPLCPPGTPLLPLPTHCLLPDSRAVEAPAQTSGPSDRTPWLLWPLALTSAAAVLWYHRRTAA
ncbi:MAG: hypothetical protein KDB10_24040, partial [Acidimicrobiales bacterium]|nr:hypothetical protein [Acidimicrobiales bacterium]